jgi:hypothetical protein
LKSRGYIQEQRIASSTGRGGTYCVFKQSVYL